MLEDKTSDDPMILILAELKSLNRTLKLLAGHLMDQEAPPRPAVDGMIPLMSDELPQRLANHSSSACVKWNPDEESICWVNYGELGAAPEEFFPTKLVDPTFVSPHAKRQVGRLLSQLACSLFLAYPVSTYIHNL